MSDDLYLFSRHNLSSDSRESLADLLKKEKDRIVYDRHFYYFNFTSHKLSLNLINMVRQGFQITATTFHEFQISVFFFRAFFENLLKGSGGENYF